MNPDLVRGLVEAIHFDHGAVRAACYPTLQEGVGGFDHEPVPWNQIDDEDKEQVRAIERGWAPYYPSHAFDRADPPEPDPWGIAAAVDERLRAGDTMAEAVEAVIGGD